MSVLEPNPLAIVSKKLHTQFEEDVRGHFLCDYGNFLQLEIAVRFGTCAQQRRSRLGYFPFRKRRVQEQVATIFHIAEIHTQTTAIPDLCPKGLPFVASLRRPDLPSTPPRP